MANFKYSNELASVSYCTIRTRIRVHHSRKCFRLIKYDLRGKNTTQSGTNKAFIIALTAAMPEEKTQLSSASSNFESTCSTCEAVGLSAREYTKGCSPLFKVCALYEPSRENVVEG